MKRQNELRDTIQRRLASELGVSVEVKLVGKKTLGERAGGKARRLVDRRGEG